MRYNREIAANPNVPNALSTWAAHKPLGISAVFWTGAALTLLLALVLRYTAAGRRFQAVGANPRAAWMAGLRVRTHVAFAYTAAGALYGGRGGACSGRCASASIRHSERRTCSRRSPRSSSPGRRSPGGLASATSTWVAALALTFLTQMLLILGLSTALQFIVFGAAIIVGMLISGDRIASFLGRLLRRIESTAGTSPEVKENTS